MDTPSVNGQSALRAVQAQFDQLLGDVQSQSQARMSHWQSWLETSSVGQAFRPSAENLAAYLALRCHDLRPLQGELVTWGVSSLGRCEPYVLPNLLASRGALAALDGHTQLPDRAGFEALDGRLAAHTRALFGSEPTPGIMVTFPSEAADDPALIQDLLAGGMTAARINLAHDDEEAWTRMLRHLEQARQVTGRPCRVLMDLAGPKVRTGTVQWPGKHRRLHLGDVLALGTHAADLPGDVPGVTCTLPAAVQQVRERQSVWFDDGKIGAVVEARHGGLVMLRVTHAAPDGAKLKPEKGINFPDTALNLPALTDKDRADLTFAARHADLIGYSFVQTTADVEALLTALEAEGAPDALGVILKIETRLAVRHLADLMVRASAARPCGVMIARGDLAVELGFARLTEIQEEVLWLAEAAHLPVVWATQVLEGLVKKGEAKRGEFTDAAQGVRAEMIMLNKGPFIVQGVREVAGIIARMRPHFDKKRPQFRPLAIAQPEPES